MTYLAELQHIAHEAEEKEREETAIRKEKERLAKAGADYKAWELNMKKEETPEERTERWQSSIQICEERGIVFKQLSVDQWWWYDDWSYARGPFDSKMLAAYNCERRLFFD